MMIIHEMGLYDLIYRLAFMLAMVYILTRKD
ncbi:hypothetical protein bas67_0024 [Escherichia phage ErnstBeyeler]|uniref:Uncharacterized protein n=4 Tax=Berlinvirus TaxID=2732677 RepID=A0AAE8AYS8_9CAUD|nr:hypothetical protein LXB_017 [Escherichia phage 285P]YP_009821821.1 carbohydrate ABC transporter permease [Shigella phage VB_Ship_A7]QXV76820.1 hypothetical protein bas68_0025 [Escherichia phage CarlSpitteler]QXV78417.1 hypothetical protein bas67_0024 [Escherichia phage ErnstBeyeler]ACV32492.1 unknown [Escherichia phage 285P]QBZ69006.1 carbohydrate ABC transporter permease [Shigella phage VB_Ship_A7]